MNWGYRIVVAYLVFVLILGVMAYKSFSTKVNLVAPDYYRQELAYQQQIDKIVNTAALEQPVTIELIAEDEMMEVTFPADLEGLTGTITLYRPSNAQMDRVWVLQTDEQNQQRIPVGELPRGLWKVKLEWQAQDKPYYQQKNIYLP